MGEGRFWRRRPNAEAIKILPQKLKMRLSLVTPPLPRSPPGEVHTFLIFTTSCFTRHSTKFRAGLETKDWTERTEEGT